MLLGRLPSPRKKTAVEAAADISSRAISEFSTRDMYTESVCGINFLIEGS